ncbi:MAG: hypothetical protein ACK2UW_19395, partial [Anaerolineales bacterium]
MPNINVTSDSKNGTTQSKSKSNPRTNGVSWLLAILIWIFDLFLVIWMVQQQASIWVIFLIGGLLF